MIVYRVQPGDSLYRLSRGFDCSPVVVRYIEDVNPRSMERPPFMHGFVIGSTCLISEDVQSTLHKALAVDMPQM